MVGGDDGETGLFSGVETTDRPPLDADDAVLPQDGPVLDPGAAIRRWLADLTYDEVHAFTLGFAPWFLFLVTGYAALAAVALTTTLAAAGVIRSRNRALLYVIREPHYFLGGGVLGWMSGASILAWFQLLSTIVGVVA